MITRLISVAVLALAADFGFDEAHQGLDQIEGEVTATLADRDEQIADLTTHVAEWRLLAQTYGGARIERFAAWMGALLAHKDYLTREEIFEIRAQDESGRFTNAIGQLHRTFGTPRQPKGCGSVKQ